MSDELQKFRARLIEEATAIGTRIRADPSIDPRLFLIAAVRCYDAEHFKAEIGLPVPITEWLSILDFGINPMLGQLIPLVAGRRGFPMFAMDEEIRGFSLGILAHHGRIAMAHRLLDLAQAGLMKAIWESGRVEFEVVDRVAGAEALDRIEYESHRKPRSEQWYDVDQLESDLHDNVRVWLEHFIGYEPTPLIDEVYTRRALELLERDSEYGAVQPVADFGDFSGSELLEVGTLLHSYHLKHAAFCMAYFRKFPGRWPENVLTIWTRKDDLTATISEHSGLSAETVRSCLETLVLGAGNADYHLRRQTKSLAALIEVGDDMWMRPLSTGTTPMNQFAAIELRRARPAAWSRNINLREDHFRRDLLALFTGGRFIGLDKGKDIKVGGRIVTDIDAVIFDRVSGTLALFQLKWQDIIGWDERERRSRAQNFTKECRDWTSAVLGFIADKSPSEVAQGLGIPGKAAKGAQYIKLFILARSAARFSGFDLGDESAVAIATWPQLVRVTEVIEQTSTHRQDPFGELHARLQIQRGEKFTPEFLPMSFDVAGMHVEANSWFFRAPGIETVPREPSPAPKK